MIERLALLDQVPSWFKEYAVAMRKLNVTQDEAQARWVASLEDRQRLAAEFLALRAQTFKPQDMP